MGLVGLMKLREVILQYMDVLLGATLSLQIKTLSFKIAFMQTKARRSEFYPRQESNSDLPLL